MPDLESLSGDLAACSPTVARAIDADDLRTPDLEMPVFWAGSLGEALTGAWADLDDVERSAALAVVERHLTLGSEALATCVATGLLEHLAHEVSAGRLDASSLAAHLGPRSRDYLDAYDDFTLGRSSLSAPTQADATPTGAAPAPARRRRRPRWRRR